MQERLDELKEKIDAYLDSLKEVFIYNQEIRKRRKGLTRKVARVKRIGILKDRLQKIFNTKYEYIPESYWKSQEKITSEDILEDQLSSLEPWIDYFSSPESEYIPDSIKYWVLRSVVALQEYDKEAKKFPKRSRGTVRQFPDLNRKALAYVLDAVAQKFNGQSPEFSYDIRAEEQEEFQQYLANENFAKLYAWAVELIGPTPEHLLKVTDGKWMKYDKGSNHASLVESVRFRGTGWCIAIEKTARSYLDQGDFHVYYTFDDEKNPTVPRVLIRMAGDKIAEIRGIAKGQVLDNYMFGSSVLKDKLKEFPDKERYFKNDCYTAQLFLYEVKNHIKGFLYIFMFGNDSRASKIVDVLEKHGRTLKYWCICIFWWDRIKATSSGLYACILKEKSARQKI